MIQIFPESYFQTEYNLKSWGLKLVAAFSCKEILMKFKIPENNSLIWISSF